MVCCLHKSKACSVPVWFGLFQEADYLGLENSGGAPVCVTCKMLLQKAKSVSKSPFLFQMLLLFLSWNAQTKAWEGTRHGMAPVRRLDV